MTRIWELDFYSRPILDEAGKKLWEVAIAETVTTVAAPDSTFRYADFVTGDQVNSVTLQDALKTAIAEAGSPPDRIRYFRRPMNNMIRKACTDLGLPCQLSRRTVSLHNWLEERQQQVYASHPGYNPGPVAGVQMPDEAPQPLPDALRGDRWALVDLPFAALAEHGEWAIDFGEAFPLTGLDLPDETPIPGLIIFASRAMPIAAWLSGLEPAWLTYASPAKQLLLETGGSERWTLAALNVPALQQEAAQFTAAKQAAKGLHFLAVQADPNSDRFAGFWLLRELPLG
ncbi:Tab2/Atab2 family RNA-binding protein [Synechococcus elongatus]|uniref:Tab2/Atab2 family RNA-binding protein n=1 Tax=Synechococcus elongatus PCC 11802 TaxID=2283154 RepID=A0AAT9JYU7_SYNEL